MLNFSTQNGVKHSPMGHVTYKGFYRVRLKMTQHQNVITREGLKIFARNFV